MSSAVESFVMATQDKQLQDGDVLNGNVENVLREDDATTFVKNGRIIKKAKRFGKSLAQLKGRRSSEENKHEHTDGNTEATAVREPPIFSKNSRKSRSATGRGLPKKGKRFDNTMLLRVYVIRMYYSHILYHIMPCDTERNYMLSALSVCADVTLAADCSTATCTCQLSLTVVDTQ